LQPFFPGESLLDGGDPGSLVSGVVARVGNDDGLVQPAHPRPSLDGGCTNGSGNPGHVKRKPPERGTRTGASAATASPGANRGPLWRGKKAPLALVFA